MNWILKYHDEDLFKSQYQKLSPAAKKKLARCLNMLSTQGPNVRFCDNHQIEVNHRKYHTMDLSGEKRLVYSYNGKERIIVLHDCDNHTLDGVKYCSNTTFSIAQDN
jgi:mRNA-degrading endonuclease YafQ of YafQ-DinJ toxin-antitoxin module